LADFIEPCLPTCEVVRLGVFVPPTRHIFVATLNVGAEIVATRVGKRSMNPADKMAAKIEPAERPRAGVAGSIDKLDEQLRVSVEALLHPSPPRPPVEELDDLLSAINHHLGEESSERKAIFRSLTAVGNEIRGRHSPGFARYLVAICIGVAAALLWQSYGEAAKQMIATKTLEFGWSPETKQMIASWVRPARLDATANVANTPKVPAASSPDPQQLQQIKAIAALQRAVERQLGDVQVTVQQLAAGQDQIARQITELRAADEDILAKIPVPSPPPASTRKPSPIGPHPSSRPLPTH
jgi:hypothetical protein